jgi:phytol kinase
MDGAIVTFGLIASLLGFMALMSRLVTAGVVHPEISRKALHLGMGLMCLTFPWLFPGPGWFAIGFTLVLATLAAVRYVPWLRKQLTSALHAVERSSAGDIYFAVSVALLYIVARGEPVLYLTPLLVLTIADALAALTGVFYAKTKYECHRGTKSWEGTTIFFVISFLCIHLSISVLADFSPAEAATVAVCLALVATFIEGASWQGLDNLFLPVALYLLLEGFVRLNGDHPEIANIGLNSAIALISLTAVGWGLNRVTGIATDAMMALITFAYFFWTVAEFKLLIPAAIIGTMFLAVSALWHPLDLSRIRGRTVVAICFPICGLIIAQIRGVPVDIIFSGHVAMAAAGGLVASGLAYRDTSRRPSVLAGALIGLGAGALVLGAWFLFAEGPPNLWKYSAAIVTAGVIGGAMGGVAQLVRLSESRWLGLTFLFISATALVATLI